MKRWNRMLYCLVLQMLLIASLLIPASAQAASYPFLAQESAYVNGSVRLKWSGVDGATGYVVYRAQVNPSTGKIGSWKKWAVTKNTFVNKKDIGDYVYCVRAFRGSKFSKASPVKRIFAANAVVTHRGYDGSRLNFRILVANRTSSPMGFLINSVLGVQNQIYALNRSTGKIVKSWPGNLVPAGAGGYAVVVNPWKTQSIYIQSPSMTSSEYSKYRGCRFIVACSFYPNPNVEPLTTQLAFACSGLKSESSVASK